MSGTSGKALHAAAVTGRLGLAATVEWLQRRINEAAEDVAEERSRRLESDADAVQVVTIHGAKGLQFPVVYVPYGWGPVRPGESRPYACTTTTHACWTSAAATGRDIWIGGTCTSPRSWARTCACSTSR